MIPRSSAHGGTASARVGVSLLVPGILSLIYSVLYDSQIPAFVGLGLTFWGAVFLLIRSSKYVTSDVVYNSAFPSYSTIDRIIRDFGYKGAAYYIPPYPQDVYLPDHLKGLKEPVVFLSATSNSDMPPIEEIAASKFQLKDSRGALITSPGSGLLSQIEKELNADFTKMNLKELCEALPHVISENLGLSKETELLQEETEIQLRLSDSLYQNLYSKENNFKSVNLLGCPIASAVACAIAKSSGKPVMIKRQRITPAGQTIGIWYRIVEA